MMNLPPELWGEIVSYLQMDHGPLINVLLLNRHFNSMTKLLEPQLVRQFTKHSDPLAYTTVISSQPTFVAFYTIQRQQKYLDWVCDRMKEADQYKYCFRAFEDANFHESIACPRILRAGFLLFCQLYLCRSLNEKVTYLENLSLEFWALLHVFKIFVDCVMRLHLEDVYPDIYLGSLSSDSRKTNHGDIFDVTYFLHEVVIFSGLRVLQDYLRTNEKFVESDETSVIEQWACNLSARYNLDTTLVNLKYIQADYLHSMFSSASPNSSGENEESSHGLGEEESDFLVVKPGLHDALADSRPHRERFNGVELWWGDKISFGALLGMCGFQEAAKCGEKDFVMALQNVSIPGSRQRSLHIER